MSSSAEMKKTGKVYVTNREVCYNTFNSAGSNDKSDVAKN
jgi:hypothetical protein